MKRSGAEDNVLSAARIRPSSNRMPKARTSQNRLSATPPKPATGRRGGDRTPQSVPRRAKHSGHFVLEEQVGFLLRAASQRNTVLFAQMMVAGLTRVQFATMAKLYEIGHCSQNELGRLILLDRATIKGVVNRLRKRGFVRVRPDVDDRRQHVLGLTESGQKVVRRAIVVAPKITEQMLEHLNPAERKQIVALLHKLLG